MRDCHRLTVFKEGHLEAVLKKLIPTDTNYRERVLQNPENYRVHRSHFAESDRVVRRGKSTVREDALPQHISLACPVGTTSNRASSLSSGDKVNHNPPQARNDLLQAPCAQPAFSARRPQVTGAVVQGVQNTCAATSLSCSTQPGRRPTMGLAPPSSGTHRRVLGDVTNVGSAAGSPTVRIAATASPALPSRRRTLGDAAYTENSTMASPVIQPGKKRKTLGLHVRRSVVLRSPPRSQRQVNSYTPATGNQPPPQTATAHAERRSRPAQTPDSTVEVHLRQLVHDLERQVNTLRMMKHNLEVDKEQAAERIQQLENDLSAARGAQEVCERQYRDVQRRNEELERRFCNVVERLNWKSLTTPDSQWNSSLPQLVGLPNAECLEAMFEWLNWNGQADSLVYWDGLKTVGQMLKRREQEGPGRKTRGRPSRRSFTSKDALVLTLAKLRTGLSDSILATWTGIHKGCVSKIVTTWVAFMDAFYTAEFPVPTTAEIKGRISSEWKHVYGTDLVRYILDCTEYRIECPASRKAARTCYSEYKNCHTAKILGAICPLGAYVGCGEAYPGRISDLEMFVVSQFCRLIQHGDCIPSDKGFDQIQPSVAARGGRIVAPHRRGHGVQTYTHNERQDNEGIANLRIHVERHFSRVMNWGYFARKKIRLTQVDMVDKVFNVVSFICNFQKPLYKESLDADDDVSDGEGEGANL